MRRVPVDVVNDAVDFDARRRLGVNRLSNIQARRNIDLDPLEADLLDQLELVPDGLSLADHAVLDGLPELRLLGSVGQAPTGQGEAGGHGEEFAAVHGIRARVLSQLNFVTPGTATGAYLSG